MGCVRLQGNAKAIDLATLMYECRRTSSRLDQGVKEVRRILLQNEASPFSASKGKQTTSAIAGSRTSDAWSPSDPYSRNSSNQAWGRETSKRNSQASNSEPMRLIHG